MKVLFAKSFLKDIASVSLPAVKKKIASVIEELQQAVSLHLIKGVRKMVGYADYYRLRIGDYRLGFKTQESIVVLLGFKHRKDIYQVFP